MYISSHKRLMKELNYFRKNPVPNISLQPIDERVDLLNWVGSIIGPKGTPYEGGIFFLKITIPNDYPFKPPNIVFTTQIYHPNISYNSGAISLNILRNEWSLMLTLPIDDPNPDDTIAPDVAQVYKEDQQQFIKTATEWTKKYA